MAIIIEMLLWCIIPLAIVSGIQFLCCRFIKNKYLRHAGLLICAVPFVCALCAYSADSGFIIGGNVLAAIIWVIIAMFCLAGYGLAWGIYHQYRKKHV